MTSRRGVCGGRSTDELDRLICCALQERVAGSSPSPWVWRRVHVRSELPVVRIWGKFWRGYRAVVAQLSRVNTFLSAQIGFWIWPQDTWVEWRFNPCFARLLVDQYIDQYSFLLRWAF